MRRSGPLLIGLLRDYPEHADLYGRYSRLMLRTLHLDKAEQLAREGLRYDPEDRECLLASALCETARSGARPNEGLARLLTNHPESLSTVHALVVALVDSGRMAEAHRIAQAAMRADPANEHLVQMVRDAKADAVILTAAKFCEPGLDDQLAWSKHLDEANVPYLVLEFEEKMTSFEQMAIVSTLPA